MSYTIARGRKLLKETNKAKLFSPNIWIPKTAIISENKNGELYDVIVDNWLDLGLESISLTEILNKKAPLKIQWVTGIEEVDYPNDLVAIQKEAVEFCVKRTRGLVWLWAGSGKTKIGIDTANILFQHRKIKRLYWITPQFERALPQLEESFKRWLNEDIEVLVKSINWFSYNIDDTINSDDCVIIDEAHRVKNGINIGYQDADCKLAENIRKSIHKAGYVYGLTADSCTNGILDLFGILYCIDKNIIIEKGTKLKDYLLRKGDRIVGVKSVFSFLHYATPYIFHQKKIDYDYRQMQYKDYPILLTEQESSKMNLIYEKINKFNKHNTSIVDAFTRMTTLAYKVGGLRKKNKTLNSIIKKIPEQDQIIIFGFTINSRYADIPIIRDALRNNSIAELHGGQNDGENMLSIQRFRDKEVRILLASYGCGAELLDFPNANHVIIYGHSLNPIHRRQGECRIDRLTQKKTCTVHNIYIKNSVEGFVNDMYNRKLITSNDISIYMKNNSETLNNNYEIS